MSNILLKGIYPALVTPLNDDGTVKKESVGAIMEHNFKNGALGYYICGTTGEGPVMTLEQRMKTAAAAVEANAGRGLIINHIGAASPFDALELARHSGEIGCDAISSVVPNFFYKYSDNEILEYYKRIADASGLPVIAYAQSMLAGADVVSFMDKLMKIDGVIGVKFTLTDFYSMGRIKALNGGDINVINGPDEMLICGLSMGADAGIGSTYNVMCKQYCALYEAFGRGDTDAARALQRKINRVVEIIIRHGVIRTIKFMLCEQGMDAGSVMFPGAALGEAEKASIHCELDAVGYYNEY
ncbi:MAG: hypothetical protein GX051_01890 [Clostridiales bacterium]|nr:hypothetical protein [Clostridiales bacterium]